MRDSLASGLGLPGWDELLRVLLLVDYNTRVVVLGTSLLGVAGGLVGVFMLLRKRSLVADAVSHATLPGIAVAFLVMVGFGGSGKFLPGLLVGGLLSGLAGMGMILLIRSVTRLKEDAALGIVLSVFFGVGAALLGVIQKLPRGSSAGLESFIFGKTASMLLSDALLILAASVGVAVVTLVLFKELSLVCFDSGYARAQGFNPTLIDALMMGLVVAVTVIGLQAVGLILVVAVLIIPPTSARFWTDNLGRLTILSAGFGAVSGYSGAVASALVPGLPSGAVIVTLAGLLFFASLVIGTKRGALRLFRQRRAVAARVDRQNLLRFLFEHAEQAEGSADGRSEPCGVETIRRGRDWTRRKIESVLRPALKDGLVALGPAGTLGLTEVGRHQARRIVRNHRLWEEYLTRYADTAAGRVDHTADEIEHVLGVALVRELESSLGLESGEIPESPHPLAAEAHGGRR